MEAARQRAARERAERVEAALKQLPKIEEKKAEADKGKARASTSDAAARVTKMGDGGFAKKEDIEKLSGPELNCRVFAPVQVTKTDKRATTG